ncbi:hypothetical protein [Proteiniphilum sp.]|uniref:phage major capsid protein n=1 Tax=Proteiniphilum sp. TaxID=1926877 RepID=UPI002B21F337|nr:hypothetical protein [Proteiniphilum sp.]MEA4916550.1 hypothetical protein [Proteiniphilum sp.]MEA4948773.1 hypothetical protein [Petrimonas sp.]
MKTKLILSVLFSLLFSVVFGGVLSAASGLPAVPVISVLAFASFIPMPQGVLGATVYREVWTKEIIKTVNQFIKDTFLDGILDLSRYVTGDGEAQVIHNTYFGVQPDVLINNTTYPIDVQALNGSDVPISLDKYQTKATPITDDELYALSYDKMGIVKTVHGEAIAENRLKKAIHALAPSGNTAKTPVIATTGAETPDGSRKRLKWEDIITMREKYAAAGIAVDGMRMVLCPDHVNDLLLEDSKLFKTLTDWKSGVVPSQLGFELRSYIANPYFNATTLAKLSFGTLPQATDKMATVIFTPKLARKASGLTKMYFSEAKTDPLNQRNLINFRNYFIALPTINEAIGAIVSAPGE